jgi:hypothetical protein
MYLTPVKSLSLAALVSRASRSKAVRRKKQVRYTAASYPTSALLHFVSKPHARSKGSQQAGSVEAETQFQPLALPICAPKADPASTPCPVESILLLVPHLDPALPIVLPLHLHHPLEVSFRLSRRRDLRVRILVGGILVRESESIVLVANPRLLYAVTSGSRWSVKGHGSASAYGVLLRLCSMLSPASEEAGKEAAKQRGKVLEGGDHSDEVHGLW